MNNVQISGRVKRDAKAVHVRDDCSVMDFSIEVETNGKKEIYDCRTTSASAAMEQLNGELFEGEEIEIEGHLQRRTWTDRARVAGSFVEVRNTNVIIFVDKVGGIDVD